MGIHVIKSTVAPSVAPTVLQVGAHWIKTTDPKGQWIAVGSDTLADWVDQSAVAGAVAKTGSTMTGPLYVPPTLPDDSDNIVTTKKYVDDLLVQLAGWVLPLAGGTMTGDITLDDGGIVLSDTGVETFINDTYGTSDDNYVFGDRLDAMDTKISNALVADPSGDLTLPGGLVIPAGSGLTLDSGSIDLTNGFVTSSKVPTQNYHLTNKEYVDTAVAGAGGGGGGSAGADLSVNPQVGQLPFYTGVMGNDTTSYSYTGMPAGIGGKGRVVATNTSATFTRTMHLNDIQFDSAATSRLDLVPTATENERYMYFFPIVIPPRFVNIENIYLNMGNSTAAIAALPTFPSTCVIGYSLWRSDPDNSFPKTLLKRGLVTFSSTTGATVDGWMSQPVMYNGYARMTLLGAVGIDVTPGEIVWVGLTGNNVAGKTGTSVPLLPYNKSNTFGGGFTHLISVNPGKPLPSDLAVGPTDDTTGWGYTGANFPTWGGDGKVVPSLRGIRQDDLGTYIAPRVFVKGVLTGVPHITLVQTGRL